MKLLSLVRNLTFTLVALCLTWALAMPMPTAIAADAAKTPAPADAAVYIITPQDGDTVSSPISVKFGLSGMGVAPAGVEAPKTGHHHLLIDLEELPDFDQPLAATAQIKHFGGGQTETNLELPAGTHTLQLLLGDYTHIPHTPPVVSAPITITVK